MARFAALALSAVLLACAQAPPPVAEPADEGSAGEVLTVQAARAEDDAAPLDEAVAGLTAFTHDLHAAFASPEENAVFSPLSIALAFGMARAGAGGATAREIDEVLHLPDDVHAALGALEQRLVTTDGSPPVPDREQERDAGEPRAPVVAIANGLFAQEGLAIKERFLETLARHYGVGVHVVDFRSPDATKAVIDAWVAEQTAERIEELFASLDPATELVLANAVYLKADWQHPFAKNPVRPAPFTRIDGSTVRADMMTDQREMPYASGDGWQAVELGYAGGELAMWVLVPDEITDPAPLLAPETLAQVAQALRPAQVALHLPQWDFATDLDLKELLAGLGMTTPFGTGADFSGITDAGLFIDQAVHKANITVDEWGTEAAAVTGLGFLTSGPPPTDAVVRADRPFAFVIRHLPTGAPLFAGHVADPTAG